MTGSPPGWLLNILSVGVIVGCMWAVRVIIEIEQIRRRTRKVLDEWEERRNG